MSEGFHIKPLKDLVYLSETIQMKKLLQKYYGNTTKYDDSFDCGQLEEIETE